ncbi:MAG: pentapeptide repeat-containing protein [Nodosilinea sp.]
MSETPAPQPADAADPSLSLQQTLSGDRNQAIGQVYGGIVLYLSGGQAIINPAPGQPPQPEPQPAAIGPNPYRGLLAFHEADSAVYFGRSREIKALWDRFQALQGPDSALRLLPIYGPSGSGKSSLARAGLIPELGHRPLPGRDRARVAVLMPGTQPLQALAAILARIAENDLTPVKKTREFAEELALPNKEGQYDGLQRIASLLPEIATLPLIVLVDQFEEVYSLCKDDGERDIFIANLLQASGDRSRYVSVILTMRSDFLGETQKHPTLNRLFSTQGFLVPTMDEEALREAIAKPAELAGSPLDKATVDLLIEQTEGREGALPLLQFALTRIWEGLRQGVAPAVTLAQIGGVGGALAGEAQRVYDSLSPEEQAIARRVFLGLVQLGEEVRDTRRRAHLSELIASDSEAPQVRGIIARFAANDARFLTTSLNQQYGETIEVTHEALIRNWSQLRDWLNGNREALRQKHKIEQAAEEWVSQGKPKGYGYLLQGRPLRDAREFMKTAQGETTLSSLSTEFVKASQRRQRQGYIKSMVGASIPIGTLMLLHFWVIDTAGRQLYDPERNFEIKYLIQYLWLTGHAKSIQEINLSHEDLSRVYLPLSRFSDADLSYVDFFSASLRGVDFLNVKLQGANLISADLKDSLLSGGSLEDSDLRGADLQGATIRDISLKGAFLEGAQLKNAVLENINLKELHDASKLNKAQLDQVSRICNVQMPKHIEIKSNLNCPLHQ